MTVLDAIADGSRNIILQVSAADLREVMYELILRAEEQAEEARKPPEEKTLSRKEVAQLLGVSLGTVINREKEGVLKPIYFGRSVRYKASDIDRLLD